MKPKPLGNLILVTGFFGAGKSTLAQAAIDRIDQLSYLTTVTTRPARPEEVEYGSREYDFVSQQEYSERMSGSEKWDHTFFSNHSYGADVEVANRKLREGRSLICCIAPDEDTIVQMSRLYAVKPIVIWIDTPLEVANDRLVKSGNKRRADRLDHKLQNDAHAVIIEQQANISFNPTRRIADDGAAFVELVERLLAKKASLRES
jgi:guanylate kinase